MRSTTTSVDSVDAGGREGHCEPREVAGDRAGRVDLRQRSPLPPPRICVIHSVNRPPHISRQGLLMSWMDE